MMKDLLPTLRGVLPADSPQHQSPSNIASSEESFCPSQVLLEGGLCSKTVYTQGPSCLSQLRVAVKYPLRASHRAAETSPETALKLGFLLHPGLLPCLLFPQASILRALLPAHLHLRVCFSGTSAHHTHNGLEKIPAVR